MTITAPLVALTITQGISLLNAEELEVTTKIIKQRKSEQVTKKSSNIEANLDSDTKRAVIPAKGKGVSS